ncbi:MAG: cytochrome c/FTR1 family iron permease [Bdellovibrionales bacterium]|nr:cytochrome c/FTR1 family iron permease [Bdellovibrionales bacterium]
MKKIIFTLSILFSLSVAALANPPAPKNSPDIVVHLLDYLAKDYGGAVQNGKVVSKSEYAEQVEFAEIVEKNANGVEKLHVNQEFMSGINRLQSLIRSKGAAEEVSKLARNLQQDAIRLAGIEVAPTHWPDLAKGASLYQANCVSCHGASGRGDGIAGASLDPKPANFHDPDLVWNSAPYKFYNTIRLGVPGTGMAAFSHLSDEDVWALAFYLKSLPYADHPKGRAAELSLKEAATFTDADIAERLGGKSDKVIAMIGSLRTDAGGPVNKDPMRIAEELLNESVAAAKENDFESAGRLSLRAYLEGIEPLEPKMKANLPGFVEDIESRMSAYRASLDKREPIAKIEAQKSEIFGKLREAKNLFSQNKMSPAVAFGAAFSIFLREGFEAVLIIIVLISILRAMGQPEAIRWVHVGWGTAVGVGLITWFASGLLISMSGLSREIMEGAISILAVMVLVYVGFWLHRYSELKKWRDFLEAKLKHGLNKGSYLLLAVVAFMAVFREAFEVVLFLRAIWIDLESSGQTIAGTGVLSSFILLMGLSYFAVRESKKLPLRKLFQVCSWTMIALAVVLAGKGIHSLQEAGIVPVSTLAIPLRMDLVGLYPSIQTLAVQAIVIAVFGFLLLSDKARSQVTS